MTLVLGINLSDRIYLAGDTQISNSVTKEAVGYCTKVLSFRDRDNRGHISCAFAGNKKFIRYITEKISNACLNGRLSVDIFEFEKQITSFLKPLVTDMISDQLTKNAKFIFAGESLQPNTLKRWDIGESMGRILKGEAFRITDPHAITAMQLGIVNCRPQHMFLFEINEGGKWSTFGISSEFGGTCSVLSAGAVKVTEEEKNDILKFLLYHGNVPKEPEVIVRFLKSKFSETIGGAVTLGWIGPESRIPGHLVHFGYTVQPAKEEKYNWSVTHNGSMYAINPQGEKIDLLKGFLNDEDIVNMEL